MKFLTGLSRSELLALRPEAVAGRRLSVPELEAIMKACDCHWIHNGNPAAPHVELTSGKCSNGFVNMRLVLCRPNLCEIMAEQLRLLVSARYSGNVDWVIGSATASTNLAYEVARKFGAMVWPLQKGEEEVRKGDKVEKKKIQVVESMTIPDGATILHPEELVTTSGTCRAVRDAIYKANPSVKFVPFLPVIVHRPEAEGECMGVDNSKIVYLVHYDIWVSDPATCPLCAQGSVCLRPAKNWAELTAA